MNAKTTVNTVDVEAALDYLAGLVEVLHAFTAEQRGRHEADALLEQLQELPTFDPQNWAPLRYQSADGQGWENVARNVGDLRQRLLGPYSESAL